MNPKKLIMALFFSQAVLAKEHMLQDPHPHMTSLKAFSQNISIPSIITNPYDIYLVDYKIQSHRDRQVTLSPIEIMKMTEKESAIKADIILEVESDLAAQKDMNFDNYMVLSYELPRIYNNLAWELWTGLNGIKKDEEFARTLLYRVIRKKNCPPNSWLILSAMLLDNPEKADESYAHFKYCVKKFPHIGLTITLFMYINDKKTYNNPSESKSAKANLIDYILSSNTDFDETQIRFMYVFLKKILLESPESLRLDILQKIVDTPFHTYQKMVILGYSMRSHPKQTVAEAITSYATDLENLIQRYNTHVHTQNNVYKKPL